MAAKEAVYKAFQALPGAEAISWQDIEVTRTDRGRPLVRLHGRAAELVAGLGQWQLHLSLTHTDHTAAASAILEGEAGDGRREAGDASDFALPSAVLSRFARCDLPGYCERSAR